MRHPLPLSLLAWLNLSSTCLSVKVKAQRDSEFVKESACV
jgi:hypothetical protein